MLAHTPHRHPASPPRPHVPHIDFLRRGWSALEYAEFRAEVGDAMYWRFFYQYAARSGDADLIQMILDNGVSVDARYFPHSGTALLYGDRSLTRFLLERGADPNIENGEELTALHDAAARNDVERARLLLEFGADARLRTRYGTPLEVAMEAGAETVTALLEAAGARKTTLAEEAAEAGYPSFTAAFVGEADMPARRLQSPHFSFCFQRQQETLAALQVVRRAIAASPKAPEEVAALLAGRDGRAHLVGGVAVLLGVVTEAALAALWQAIDRGGDASPPLATIAAMVDPAFPGQARSRIEAACGLSGAAPAPYPEIALTALFRLCQTLSGTEPWLAPVYDTAILQKAFSEHWRRGDTYALSWHTEMIPALEEVLPRFSGNMTETFAV